MLWYMIKTWPGREEELAREIHRTVPPAMYSECFVIHQERIWRKQQHNVLHTEPFLPGAVFLTCRETEPLFGRLEQIPSMSRMIAAGSVNVLPLMQEDAEFLGKVSGEEHIVRLSYVEKAGKKFGEPVEPNCGQSSISGDVLGPLRVFDGRIERYEFKKRYAVARHRFLGEERRFSLGILTCEDVGGEILYQGTPILSVLPVSDHYTLLEIGKDASGKNTYRVCETVTVLEAGEAAIPMREQIMPAGGLSVPGERNRQMIHER